MASRRTVAVKLSRNVVAGLAACLAGTAPAGDAASAETQSAPLDYVRVCDGSGTAFLTLPGTDTCLVLGGHRVGALTRYPANRAEALTEEGRDSWAERDFFGSRVPTRAELLAYTATFDEGHSTSISFDEPASRVVGAFASISSAPDAKPISINGISAPAFRGGPVPEVQDIVGNIRRDEPLGAVQLDSAAALQVHAGLFAGEAHADPSLAYPVPALPTNSIGLSSQGGTQPNMDYLSPGDRLWLQAAYGNGAYGTIADAPTVAGSGEVDPSRFGRAVLAPLDGILGSRPQPDAACVGTGSFTCEPRWGHGNDSEASKRERPPTFSSAVSGSSRDIRYESGAIAGFGGAVAMPSSKDAAARPRFIGMPISGFDIGAEFMYIKVKQAHPAQPSNVEPKAPSAPDGAGASEYRGRVRVQRAY